MARTPSLNASIRPTLIPRDPTGPGAARHPPAARSSESTVARPAHGDAEDRMVGGDALEVRERCRGMDGEVRPRPRSALQVAAEDGGALTECDVLQPDRFSPAVPDDGAAAG